MYEIGCKYLVTTDAWFYAPDGGSYRAVWGTLKGIREDSGIGIKTNRNSTNWYLEIGNTIIAGCQIHYAIRCDECNTDEATQHDWGEGAAHEYQRGSAIYNADV